MKNKIEYAVAFVLLAAGPMMTVPLRSADVVPGSYSTTIKGRLADGQYFTKLAMYSFQAGGTMREDLWYWHSDEAGSVYGSSSVRAGVTSPPDSGHPNNRDTNTFLVGMLKFLNATPTSLYGTWTMSGKTVTIQWSWGDSESWRWTWTDPNHSLHKLELFSASYVTGGTYLEGRGTNWFRNPAAVNAGWAFGGPGVGFDVGSSISTAASGDFRGLYSRFNAWCSEPGVVIGDEGVHADTLNLTSFKLTDTGVLRLVQPASGCGCESCIVFSYFSKPVANPGMLARRVMYLTGHDWNCDGTLSEGGHTYCGLEILDGGGGLHGFVFSDASNASGCTQTYRHTISSLIYLDTTHHEAFFGTDPEEREDLVRVEGPLRINGSTLSFSVRSPMLGPITIETSTNLSDWSPWTVVSNETGVVDLEDTVTAGTRARYYRALVSN